LSGGCETVAAGGSATVIRVAYGGFCYIESGAVVSQTGVAGYQEVDAGGLASGVTVSSGGCETVETGGIADNVAIDLGADSFVESGGTLSGAGVFGYQEVDGGTVSSVTILSGGSEFVLSNGTVNGATISLGATQFIYSGTVSGGTVLGYQEVDSAGNANGITVSSGATQTVESGGVASNTILAGGREVVSSGGTVDGAVTFAGSGGRLILEAGAAFDATISGFTAGDTLNLAAISFAGATVGYSNGTLTVSDGTHSVALTLAGSYAAAGFGDASNGAGGTLVTYTPPSGQAGTDSAFSQLVQAMALPSSAGAIANPTSGGLGGGDIGILSLISLRHH
jgi:autotransporter passenger strand-loop-strand repeat protein